MLHRGSIQEKAVANALESPATRRILSLCIDKPRPVKELSETAGLPLASAYRQVKGLLESGILVVERSAMTSDGKPFDLYRSRIRVGRLEVRANKVLVTWESNEGIEDRLASMWGHLAG
jgi:predicted ArsR family transcriptional regulator